MQDCPVITIDGPSASGKSSVSRGVAQALGWNWLSTGAFYRGLAWVSIREGVAVTDESGLAQLAREGFWHVEMRPDNTHVIYRGSDVTSELASEETGQLASQISAYPAVRSALLEAQRECASAPGLVAEGRDCGSVVFPGAQLKIYLTASTQARANRRVHEQGGSIDDIAKAHHLRDQQDKTRTAAPLQMPEGGLLIDTSSTDLPNVINIVISHARKTFK